MNAKKSIVLAGMLLACMTLCTGCPEVITEVPPEPPPGEVIGELEPLTAFLSANRTVLVQDSREGNATLTVTTTIAATFEWTLSGPDSDADGTPDWVLTKSGISREASGRARAELIVDFPDEGDPVTTSTLQIREVVTDPGPTGSRVTIDVTATAMRETGEEEIEQASLFLTIVRPEAPLSLAGTVAEAKSTIVPGERITLEAAVTGGKPFASSEEAQCVIPASLRDLVVLQPADNGNPFCLFWAVEGIGPKVCSAERDTSCAVSEDCAGDTGPCVIDANQVFGTPSLVADEDGAAVSRLTYQAPIATGNVTIKMAVQDAAGNRETTVVPLVISSLEDLRVSLSSGVAGAQPSAQVDLNATVSGGTPPYKICYAVSQGSLSYGDADCANVEIANTLYTKCSCNLGSASSLGLDLVIDDRTFFAPNAEAQVAIRVAAMDNVGAISTDVLTMPVSSREGNEVSLVVVVEDPRLCPGETTRLTASATGGTGVNTFTFGGIGSPPLDEPPCADECLERVSASVYDYTAPSNPGGSFTRLIRVKVTETGGSDDTRDVYITTEVGPTANAGSNKTVCAGVSDISIGSAFTASGGTPPYSFLWSRQGGGPDYLDNPTIAEPTFDVNAAVAGEGPAPFTITLCVDVRDTENCGAATDCVDITVNPLPQATADNSGPVCAGDSVTLNGPPGLATYSWTGPGGFTSSAEDPTVTPAVAGTYTLEVTDANACRNVATTNVVVDPAPTANAGADQDICDDESAVLAGSIANSPGATWSGGSGTFVPDANTLNAVYTPSAAEITAGSVTLTLTAPATGACSASAIDTMKIKINRNPDATITPSSIALCAGEQGSASVAGAGAGASYVWQIPAGMGTIGTGQGTPQITYTAGAGPSVQINVTVTKLSGCESTDSISLPITDPASCDDGLECTADVCSTGICSNPNLVAGTPCGSGSANDCDVADTCNGLGACVTNTVPDGTSCTDDGNDCTDDVCAAGACTHPNLIAGTPCGDPTDDDCTNPDTCNGVGTCLDNHEGDGTACDDGLFCNENEQCTSGVCGGGNALDCSDALSCTLDVCDDVANQCNHTTLVVGTCLIGGVCFNSGDDNSGNECQECIPANNPFAWSNKGAGALCGDQSNTLCTDPDTCDGAGSCLDRHAADGTACQSDGDDCTDDECAAGVCEHPFSAAGTPCGDPGSSDCDSANTCDGAGTCEANPVPDGTSCTDDGNDCTEDVCEAGICTHPNLGAGAACGDPTDTECDNPDTCDGAGSCQDNVEVAGTACGDPSNSTCDGADTCDGLGNCLEHIAPFNTPCGSSANNQCTDPDICDGFGSCDPRNEDAGTPCGSQSSSECDGPNQCDGAGTCSENHVVGPCTDDGNECTDDVCNGGACTHPDMPDGTGCDDGAACNVGETCQAGACTGGGPPDCSGTGDQCNADSTCDPGGAEGNCDIPGGPINEGQPCDDGLGPCSVGETCQTGSCTGGAPPDCSGAGDQCNTASCDPVGAEGNCDILDPVSDGTGCNDSVACTEVDICTTGTCGGTPNDALCDDGLFCSGIEVCDQLLDCQPGTDPCPGAVCCEDTDTCAAECCSDGDCPLGQSCVGGVCQ